MEHILKRITPTLDRLATLYALDVETFKDVYLLLPEDISAAFDMASTTTDYVGTEDEDTVDYMREVYYYYHPTPPVPTTKIYNSFTLRNPLDLEVFSDFLTRLERLLELSPAYFVKVFPLCPPVLWDKIDDLRETSYKLSRDSPMYIKCLEQCKKLSYAYSKRYDIVVEEEEEIEDTYYLEEDETEELI